MVVFGWLVVFEWFSHNNTDTKNSFCILFNFEILKEIFYPNIESNMAINYGPILRTGFSHKLIISCKACKYEFNRYTSYEIYEGNSKLHMKFMKVIQSFI